jgi:hypothetical protein
MILIKQEEGYSLCIEENAFNSREFIANTDGMYVKHRLSKENCDEIFGVVDVEKLASEYAKEANDISVKYGVKVLGDNNSTPFKDGFNKATELNKDKLFTLEDVKFAWLQGEIGELSFSDIIQSLQQPTEIEVEIEMELVSDGLDEMAQLQHKRVPKLDENGCLILKKK